MPTTPDPLGAAKVCTGYDDGRTWMRKPFHQDGWNIGTDGHLVFGWQGTHIEEISTHGIRVIPVLLGEENPLAEPFILHRDTLKATLDSIPKVPGSCYVCEGSGKLRCDLGHDHECTDCSGSGFQHNGTPDQPNGKAIVVFKGLARFRVDKLMKLHLVMLHMGVPSITITHGSPNRLSRTVFPGGERLAICPDMEDDKDDVAARITNGQA